MEIVTRNIDKKSDSVHIHFVVDYSRSNIDYNTISTEYFTKENLNKKCSSKNEISTFNDICFSKNETSNFGFLEISGFEWDFMDAFYGILYLSKKEYAFKNNRKCLLQNSIIIVAA